MKSFDFLFGVVLGEMLLRYSENLSKTLQNKKSISAAEGQHVGEMVIDTLRSLRTEESFESFWNKVTAMAELADIDVDEPHLPRRRRWSKLPQESPSPLVYTAAGITFATGLHCRRNHLRHWSTLP